MHELDSERIIQIIPADGWREVYANNAQDAPEGSVKSLPLA